MIQATEHCYIVKDNEILSGEPIIKGTRTPVRAIAIDLAVRSIARRDSPGITSLDSSTDI